MRPMRPSKKRHSTAFVFILGIGIGISLAYAYFDVMQIDFSQSAEIPVANDGPDVPPAPAIPATPPAPVEPAPTTATEPPAPTPPVPPEPPKPDAADVAGLWPARHLFIGIEGTELSPETRELIARYKPGGVVLRAENINDESQTRQLVVSIKQAAGMGLGISQGPLVAVAQEGGDSDALNPLRLENAPFVRSFSKNNDLKAIRECAGRYAQAALSRGIGIILGPVLDVYKADVAPEEWRNRTFDDTPDGVFRLGIPFAQAIGGEGAIAVPKYYPGVAAAKHNDGHIVLDEEKLDNLAKLMYPFDAATQVKTPGLLAGRVAVPSVDTLHPTRPALQSNILVRELVRAQLKYAGVILGDDVSSGPGLEADSPAKNAVLALAAGCDAVLLLQASPEIVSSACGAITQAVQQEPPSLAKEEGEASQTPPSLVREELEKSKERLRGWNEFLAQVDGRYPLSSPTPTEGEASAKVEEESPAKVEKEPIAKEEGEIPAKAETESTTKEGEVTSAKSKKDSPAKAEGEAPAKVEKESTAKVEGETPEPAPAPAVSILPPLPPAPPSSPASTETPKPETTSAPAPETPSAPEPTPAAIELKEAEDVSPEVAATPDAAEENTPPPSGTVPIRHKIRRGESLNSISKDYGVTVADLQAWNNLKDSDIKFGHRLRIHVPEGSEAAKKAQEDGRR